MMQNEKDKDWFSRLNERLDNEPKPSDEEIAKRKQERQKVAEALEGTSRETAFMKEDHSVTVKYWSYKDGVIGDGWDEVQPNESTYIHVCERHKLSKPGDTSTITEEWVDGQWVTVLEERHDQKSDTGKAKSA
jgi:hypothetical protein